MAIRIPPDNRKYYLGFSLFIILGIASTGYMSWEAGTCEVTALLIEKSPGNIVFIADPHLRPENIAHVREVIDEVNRLRPSIVLIGGDFIYGDGEDLSLQEVWKDIDAPVYAVLGNHDYNVGIAGSGVEGRIAWVTEAYLRSHNGDTSSLYSGNPDLAYAESLAAILEQNGVTVLRNEYVELSLDGKDLIIVGVDDGWAGLADPPGIPDTDAFVIYLVHEPQWSADWDADLILAGHTHGGQYNIPAVQVLDAMDILDISGLSIKDGIFLYITRGIGTSDRDGEFRYFAPPEIVVINPDVKPVQMMHQIIV